MSFELKHTRHADIWFYKGDLPYDAFIRLPVGTIGWAVSYQSYMAPETARMIVSLDKPSLTGFPAGDDSRLTLKRLLAGEALEFTAPPNSGGMAISYFQQDMPARVDRERILYLNSICIPGNTIISFQSTIYTDSLAPERPSAEQVELVKLVNESGLAVALRKMFPGQSDKWIATQAEDAGYTQALTTLIAMARGGGGA